MLRARARPVARTGRGRTRASTQSMVSARDVARVESLTERVARTDGANDARLAVEGHLAAELVDGLDAGAMGAENRAHLIFAELRGGPGEALAVELVEVEPSDGRGDRGPADDRARVLDGVHDAGVAATREDHEP